MIHKKANLAIATILFGASLAAGTAFPAFALTLNGSLMAGASVSSSAGGAGLGLSADVQANLMVRAKDRADQEIERRDKALNALDARIQAMQKLSADQKNSLNATIQAQLTALATLKAKIDADTDATTLKADVQSITKAYRIFVLVIPQGTIIAASDRAEAIVTSMNDIGAKLQARISADQSAGKDVSAMKSAYADFAAKVSDADVQAKAAVTEVSVLTPDNGDQAKFQANLAAMKDARSKIQAAQQDFVEARKDARAIVKALRELSVSASSSASASSGAAVNP